MSLDNERFVNHLVASGQFTTRDEVLDHALQLLRDELARDGTAATGDLTAQQWCDRFEEWANNHLSLPHEADDSRESIYAGRGE